MLTLYGIPNCDTIKKARKWLDEHNIEYHFHDYKKAGASAPDLESWCESFGLEKVLNKRGTTWRKLDIEDKDNLSQKALINLMVEQPSLIKRPIISEDSPLLIGFSPETYQSLL